MTFDDQQRAFEELRGLLLRSEGMEKSLLLSLGRSRELLAIMASAPWTDHDRRLLEALGNPAQPPGPLAAGLLALRMAALAGLGVEASLDVALAGLLLRCDARRLAEERIRQSAGKHLSAQVLMLVQCRGERLDGSGPLGLRAENLDVATLVNAAACAYVLRLSKGSNPLQALAAVAGAPEIFGEGAQRLAQALSSLPLGSYVQPRLRDDGSIQDPEAERMLRLMEDKAVAPPAGASSAAPAASEEALRKSRDLRQIEAQNLETATRRAADLQELLRIEQGSLQAEARSREEAELRARSAQEAYDQSRALRSAEVKRIEAATLRAADLQELLRIEQGSLQEETRLREEAELRARSAQEACDQSRALRSVEVQRIEAATHLAADLQELLRIELRSLKEKTRLREEAELRARLAQEACDQSRTQHEQEAVSRQQAQARETAARERQRAEQSALQEETRLRAEAELGARLAQEACDRSRALRELEAERRQQARAEETAARELQRIEQSSLQEETVLREEAERGAQSAQEAFQQSRALRPAEVQRFEAAARRADDLQERLRIEQSSLKEKTRLREEAELRARSAQEACDQSRTQREQEAERRQQAQAEEAAARELLRIEQSSLQEETRLFGEAERETRIAREAHDQTRALRVQEAVRRQQAQAEEAAARELQGIEQSSLQEETRLREEAERETRIAQETCDQTRALREQEAERRQQAQAEEAAARELLRIEQSSLQEETRLLGEAERETRIARETYDQTRTLREQEAVRRQQAQAEEAAARELLRFTALSRLSDSLQEAIGRRVSALRHAARLELAARAADAAAIAREAAGFTDWSVSEVSSFKKTLESDAGANADEIRELEGRFAAALMRLGAEPLEIERLRTQGRLRRVEALWAERLREQRALDESQRRARQELVQRRKAYMELQEALRRRLRLRLEAARKSHRIRVEALWEKIEETTREVEREAVELARLREEASLDPSAVLGDTLAEDRSALAAVLGAEAESAQDLLARLTSVEAGIASSQKTLDGYAEAERSERREADDVMRRLRRELAGEMRALRAASGLPELRARLAAERQRLDSLRGAEAQALAAAKDEKSRQSSELVRARAQLKQDQKLWQQEKNDLEKTFLVKRRRLEEMRGAALETSQRRQALEGGLARAASAFQQDAAGRLAQVRGSLAARKEMLERSLAALTEETGQAQREHAEVLSAFQERRRGVEDEIRRLRAEWGDLQGLLAGCESEQAPLRQALSAALSEIDLQLLEAVFALDTARKEAASLSQEHEGRLADWERAGRELEALGGEFARLSGTAAPLFEQWRELAGGGLAGVSAVLREQLLARARELGIWSGRLSGVDRRLAASRAALEAGLFETCREAGLRAFREGRLDEARASLRQALSFRKDDEVRALLDRLEAPRQTSADEQDGAK